MPEVTGQSAHGGPDGRTGDKSGRKEDSHYCAYGNPCPGAFLSRLLALANVNLAVTVFIHNGCVVRTDHAPTVQFLHRIVVPPCSVRAPIGTDEYEHIIVLCHCCLLSLELLYSPDGEN